MRTDKTATRTILDGPRREIEMSGVSTKGRYDYTWFFVVFPSSASSGAIKNRWGFIFIKYISIFIYGHHINETMARSLKFIVCSKFTSQVKNK